MVVKEIYQRKEEYTELSRCCPWIHLPQAATNLLAIYTGIIESIQHKIGDMPTPIMRRILSVTSDVTNSEWRLLDKYKQYMDSGHHGIAYVIAINAHVAAHGNLLKRAPVLIKSRKHLLETWSAVFCKFELDKAEPCLLQSQLFLPTSLLQTPDIMEHVHQDGRVDCLGRSPWFMGHDAGLRVPWPHVALTQNDSFNRSALFLACCREDYGLLDQILQINPADGIKQAKSYPFPLHIAAAKGYTEVFRKLHKTSPVSFQDALNDDMGRTYLHFAADNGHQNTVEFLCQILPTEVLSYQTSHYNETALHLAADRGHLHVVECLIRFMDPQAIDMRDIYSRTAFFLAARQGHVEVLQLLEKYVDVDQLDKFRQAPLAAAASRGHSDVVRYLLGLYDSNHLKVRIDRVDASRRTALDYATKYRHNECVHRLKESGAFRHTQLKTQK